MLAAFKSLIYLRGLLAFVNKKTTFSKILISFFILFFAVAEKTLPILGVELGISIFLLLVIFTVAFDYFEDYTFYFFIGLAVDLILVETLFGIFTAAFLVIKLIWDLSYKTVPKLLLGILIYLSALLLINYFFFELTLMLAINAIISYGVLYFMFSRNVKG